MVCIVCKKKVAGDCFTLALESLKEHYTYYRNSFTQRDAELDKFKERNEQLNKALQLLQNEQQRRPSKKFRAHQEDSSDKHLQSAQNKNLNQNITGGLSDISLTDDETYASVSHLNMALNSEQLFETSLISPAKPEASITSALELVISPRSKAAPIRRLKEKENMRLSKAKSLETSKSENYEKESSSQTNKSWAMTLLRPTTSVATSSKRMASKVGVNIKPEKKINLSLKKANPSKMKQSILQFDNCKDASLIEPDVCDDVIDASPVPLSKNPRLGKSWAHRSGHNHSLQKNKTSPITNSTDPKIVDCQRKPDESSIENIVFDFSPTKKNETINENIQHLKTKLESKQLYFDGNDSTNCVVTSDGPESLMGSKSEDSSSVMLLTPTTQDVICIDDSTNDFGEIDTMDMLANIQKTESESIENLRQIESKNIVKKQQKELCGEHFFLKPAACIKKEKKSQANLEVQKIEDRLLHRTAFNLNTNKNQSFGITSKNAIEEKIHEQEEQVEDNDDDDAMPKPFVVKQEPKDYSHIPKKLTFKERFNIECDNCEKIFVSFKATYKCQATKPWLKSLFAQADPMWNRIMFFALIMSPRNLYRLLGPNLSDREFELHLNKCSFHNQPDMPQNTPEGFWNPLMLTFDENDPRNEVLIDNRFKDNKHQFKK